LVHVDPELCRVLDQRSVLVKMIQVSVDQDVFELSVACGEALSGSEPPLVSVVSVVQMEDYTLKAELETRLRSNGSGFEEFET
jgi:hypothetical protein